MATIALLSQPNAGKSTLFNGLTGLRQHVGNWPGKTVEKKSGSFNHNGKEYTIIDLPGSYSLYANSYEEVVTRDYIASDDADIICVLADASQLERSLFMLSDYCGINKPTILVLNMMDVAKQQGKSIDVKLLEKRLNIPVVAMSAQNLNDYSSFYDTLDKINLKNSFLNYESLLSFYKKDFGSIFEDLEKLMPNNKRLSPSWMVSKAIENDEVALSMIQENVEFDDFKKIEKLLSKIDKGSLTLGNSKFSWINSILKDVVSSKEKVNNFNLRKIDKLATSNVWGKPFAIFVIIFGLLISFIPAIPFALVGMQITAVSVPLSSYFVSLGAPLWIISLIFDALFSAIGFCISMAGFVLGVSFIFGLIEEVGLMARVSYVFDNTMSKMGLQGKSIMPLLLSLGCNMGGTASSRVIDTWGQRTLTIAMAWALPCAGCWGVVGLITSTFFGVSSVFVVLALFAAAFFHIWLTSKLFKKSLIKKDSQAGLIMELPPYHKPKWKALFKFVFSRFIKVFWKAFKIVSVVCVVIWALSFSSAQGVNNSILYRIGRTIEPVTMVFGLRWQMFIAWICSAMGKESTLGVLSALFGAGGSGIFIAEASRTAVGSNLGSLMISVISKPEAFAFLFAFMFNIPCIVTLSTTNEEIHSLKWTIRIALYYMASALIYSFIAYHVGMLIW